MTGNWTYSGTDMDKNGFRGRSEAGDAFSNASILGLSFLMAKQEGGEEEDELKQHRVLKNCSLLSSRTDTSNATGFGMITGATDSLLNVVGGLGGSGPGSGADCVQHTPFSTTTLVPEVPQEIHFSGDNLVSVIAYAVLFSLAAFGNLTVFFTLFRSRYRKSSRVNLFIMHLAMADMIVTFVMIPMEIGWHITVAWTAGDTACRIMMFWRVFGFYLSSFILITISLDRYFAILYPLRLTDADKRAKVMLAFAWLFSIVSSIPQSVIFHVEVHPKFSWFSQCVTFNFFPSPHHELAYNLFNITALYCAPLVVIVVTYSRIVYEITKKSRETRSQLTHSLSAMKHRQHAFHRSGMGRIEKARIRTLKMTIVIVMVFVTCWTPYFVISAWWWIDKESAGKIDAKIQRGLFIFAVSNSCVNPIIYGMFTQTFMREFKRCWHSRCFRRGQHSARQMSPPNSSSSKSKSRLEQLMRDKKLQGSDSVDRKRRLVSGYRDQNGGLLVERPRSVAEGLLCTTLVGGVSGEVLHKNSRIHRQLTPPHIAGGNLAHPSRFYNNRKHFQTFA